MREEPGGKRREENELLFCSRCGGRKKKGEERGRGEGREKVSAYPTPPEKT